MFGALGGFVAWVWVCFVLCFFFLLLMKGGKKMRSCSAGKQAAGRRAALLSVVGLVTQVGPIHPRAEPVHGKFFNPQQLSSYLSYCTPDHFTSILTCSAEMPRRGTLELTF